MAQTCILRAFGLQMSCRLSLVLRLLLFSFVSVFFLSLEPRPFIQSFFVLRCTCAPTGTRSYPTTVCVLFFVFVSSFFCFCFFLFLFSFLPFFCFCFFLFFFLFLPFFLFSLEMLLFPSIIASLPFPLCMESIIYVTRSFLPNGVFLPCDHGLDF